MWGMWKRLAVAAVWVAATVGTAAITLAAVGQAGNGVSERPAVPVSAEDLVAVVTAETTTSAPSSTTSGVTSTTVMATSTVPSSPSTVTTAGSSSTTLTTGASTTASRATPGGTVTVSVSGGTLGLASAIPAQGFGVDVESSGGQEVEVKFEKHDESVEYLVKAHLEDGVVKWEVTTEAAGA